MAFISWFVPNLLEGSGGHRTIFQHIALLEEAGHTCSVFIEPSSGSSAQDVKNQVERYFGIRIKGQFHLGLETRERCDLAFATAWFTARAVRDLPFVCKRAYFVQDYEACFNPMGDAYLFAENSYRYGLAPITVGRWLTHELGTRYGIQGRPTEFCADHEIYHPLPGVTRNDRAVCFIYQPDKVRRCAQIGIEALGIVKHLMPEAEVHLYGSRAAGHIWFDHRNDGLLSIKECNRLYAQCAVGLCISSSNPSRIPFEMMCAGLPVVEVHRENTLYDLPESAVQLCDTTPEALARAIIDLLRNPQRRQNMGEAGIRFMRDRPLEVGFRQFLAAVDELLQAPTNAFAPAALPAQLHFAPPVQADGFSARLPPEVRGPTPGAPQSPLKRTVKRVARPLARRVRQWLDG
jgi:hypothetical protein